MKKIIGRIILVVLLFIGLMAIYYFINNVGYRKFYKQPINSKIYDVEIYHDRLLYFYYGNGEKISDLDIKDTLRIGDSIVKQINSDEIIVYRYNFSGYDFYKRFRIRN